MRWLVAVVVLATPWICWVGVGMVSASQGEGHHVDCLAA